MAIYINRLHGAALLACGFLLSSCGSGKRLGSRSVALEPITVTANKAAMEEYRASATRVWDITHTTAKLSFNMKERTADGAAWIKMRPFFYATDTIVLDAKGMLVNKVALANDSSRMLSYAYRDNQLFIKLGKTYTQNDSLELYIRYTAMPYGSPTGGSAAISDDRGLYFINTDNKIPGKPVQIWTQGETESNSHWLPTIDKPNERFAVKLELAVPDSFTTLGNGYLAAEAIGPNGTRTYVWKMDDPIQPYAIMFAIGKFSVVKDSWRGKEVNYYVEPEYEPYARRMFQHTPEMMEFFSKVTGVPYPWNKYSQVVVRDYVSGAMENTSATLFGEFMNQNHREMIDKDYEDVVSHELFHQWFGDYVTAESWSNLTLNESFATYGEQLWRRYKYGKANADELAYDELRSYLGQAAYNDATLVRFHYESREDMFDRISYQKGGVILNYLHGLIGDEAFYKAMNIYLTRHALQPVEAHQWRIAVEDATGQDWNWFFNQWYYRGGHPDLDVQYAYDDAAQKLTVTVTQKQKELYRLPLKTMIAYSASDKRIVDWEVKSAKETFTYPYKNGQKPFVMPDVMHWRPGTLKDNKTMQQLATQYRYTDDYISKYIALAQTYKKTDDTAAQTIINLALNDTMASLREGALQMMATVKKDNLKSKWQSQVLYAAEQDPSSKVRAAALSVLGTWKVNKAQPLMVAAISDSSYAVAGAALSGLTTMNKDTAYILAKGLINTQPRAELQTAVNTAIAKQGKADDVAIFEQQMYRVGGSQRIMLASSLSEYLQNTRDRQAFEKGLSVFKVLVASESIKSYRLAIGSYVFEAAADMKEQIATSRTNIEKEQIQQRLELLRSAANDIIKAETEEQNKKQYQSYMKKVFGA
ncbi:MAG: M1 family peptidase [Sphingobacteriales bacterium]|nr:MAG: M1 family peptidase [Sphingobacteriales bacterium]